MNIRLLLTSAAAAATVAFAAGAAGAATITDTFAFTATGFVSGYYGTTPPTDPVTGSVTITFDPTQTYYNEGAGITSNGINIALDGPLLFNYSPTATSFSDGSGLAAGELIIGADGDAALISLPPSSNDIYVHILTALTDPTVQQVGYSTSGRNADYYYTPTTTITVTSVPEPASWALMIIGVAGLGGFLRESRRAAALVS